MIIFNVLKNKKTFRSLTQTIIRPLMSLEKPETVIFLF